MSKDIKEFPDLSNKLAAPVKKSLFERQKAEAAEKRAREAADTAAAYEDFVKSFEGDDDDDDALSRLGGGSRTSNMGATRGGFGGGGGAPKRHFAPSGPKGLNSGPGSLGPPPQSLQNRKRPYDGAFTGQRDGRRDRDRGLFGFEEGPSAGSGQIDAKTAFQTSDDEDEKTADSKAAERAAPKPTLQLTQLPPGTSQLVIKALMPGNITVDSVRVISPSGPSSNERRSMSAIVTLAKDTPASDMDAAVSGLSNRYLGYGFYLNISRHLSSAALGGGAGGPTITSSSSSLPFGAKPVFQGPAGPMNRAPPPASVRGSFAPPSSYNNPAGQFNRGSGAVQVKITPPSDVKQLKLIHQTVEKLLTHGPEFEALLMSRPSVQEDEKWAWIWNPRSTGGVWYRWRLWQALTGSGVTRKELRPAGTTERPEALFDAGAPWQRPSRDEALRFEFATRFEEFVSDSDYDSSDEDDSDDEGRRRRRQERGGGPSDPSSLVQESEVAYLNPLQKAKLMHLLARLPTTTGKLRKGDVARVTGFAISQAGSGADEVVDMIVSNIETPFSWSGANPDFKVNSGFDDGDDENMDGEGDDVNKDKKEKEDQTPSKLIGLYLISDILSSSSTSGVRHAWRYRQLFENALRSRAVFEKLGRLEKDLQWGRMRAEKWKRSVNSVLSLWEGWCVFPQKTQEHFSEMFNNPPLTEAEKMAEEEKAMENDRAEKLTKSKWKSVDAGDGTPSERTGADGEAMDTTVDEQKGDAKQEKDLDGEAMDDELDGQPMDDDDMDGEPMDDDEIDGEPMVDSDEEKSKNEEGSSIMEKGASDTRERKGMPSSEGGLNDAARARRQRPRAVDMFADSDGE